MATEAIVQVRDTNPREPKLHVSGIQDAVITPQSVHIGGFERIGATLFQLTKLTEPIPPVRRDWQALRDDTNVFHLLHPFVKDPQSARRRTAVQP